MGYSKFSCITARYISRETKLDQDQEEVVAYAVENLILTIAGFIFIVLVGALFRAAFPAAVAGLAGGLLRRLSGGAHASNPVKCLLFGAVGYGAMGVGAKYLAGFSQLNNIHLIGVLILAVVIVGFYAPVDCAAKPIRSTVLRKRLKVGSICFLLGVMFLVVILDAPLIKIPLTLGALYQSITLLPFLNDR